MCLLLMMMIFHVVLKIAYAMVDYLNLFLYHRHTLCKLSITACDLLLLISTPMSVKTPVMIATIMLSAILYFSNIVSIILLLYIVTLSISSVRSITPLPLP